MAQDKKAEQSSTLETGIAYATLLGLAACGWTLTYATYKQMRRNDRLDKAFEESRKELAKLASGTTTTDGKAHDHRLTMILKHLKRKTMVDPGTLTKHELRLVADILDPTTMTSRFSDIGGLDELKQEIWELVILPLREPDIIRAAPSLVQQPSGILLYGAPGCGKTMIAKAVARESGAVFLAVESSSLVQKYMGESTKMVRAAFSLARRLAPSILFLDEVNLIIGKGSAGANDSGGAGRERDSMKAEFLALWDGVSTSAEMDAVVVIGATNHPDELDRAVLRRFSRSFHIPLPNANGREQIIRALLHDQPMDESATRFLPRLAGSHTDGYSGSDLKELCRAAAMEPVREAFSKKSKQAVMDKKEVDDDEMVGEVEKSEKPTLVADQPAPESATEKEDATEVRLSKAEAKMTEIVSPGHDGTDKVEDKTSIVNKEPEQKNVDAIEILLSKVVAKLEEAVSSEQEGADKEEHKTKESEPKKRDAIEMLLSKVAAKLMGAFSSGQKCTNEEPIPPLNKDPERKNELESTVAPPHPQDKEEEKVVPKLRPLKEADFHAALSKVKRTGKAAEDYSNGGPPLTNVLYI